ncbi:hypothetical protein CLOM_g2015 [Closterium sp. NIES-68]|nr:hypothetical protein CLOM_g2015 [Closterium sp. NIES-68]GJP62632.1 hypothetical protein CLOP_g19668 [Closterium sp. NIES-67]
MLLLLASLQSPRGEQPGGEQLAEDSRGMAERSGGVAEMSEGMTGLSGGMAEMRGGMAEESRRSALESGGNAEENKGSGNHDLSDLTPTAKRKLPPGDVRLDLDESPYKPPRNKRKMPLGGDVLLELGEAAPAGFKLLLSAAGVLPDIHRRLRRKNATVLAPSDPALAAVLPLVLRRVEDSVFSRTRQKGSVFSLETRAVQQGQLIGRQESDQQQDLTGRGAIAFGSGQRQGSARQLGSLGQQELAERAEILREIALCHLVPSRISLLGWHGKHRSLQGALLSLESSGLRFTVSSVPVSNGTVSSVNIPSKTAPVVTVTVGATVVTRRLVVYTVEGVLLPPLLGGSVSLGDGGKGDPGRRRQKGRWGEHGWGGEGKWMGDSEQGVDYAAAEEIKRIQLALHSFLNRRSDVCCRISFLATTIYGTCVLALLALLIYRNRYKPLARQTKRL